MEALALTAAHGPNLQRHLQGIIQRVDVERYYQAEDQEDDEHGNQYPNCSAHDYRQSLHCSMSFVIKYVTHAVECFGNRAGLLSRFYVLNKIQWKQVERMPGNPPGFHLPFSSFHTMGIDATNAPLDVAFRLDSIEGLMDIPAPCVSAKHQENRAMANAFMHLPIIGMPSRNGSRIICPAIERLVSL